jgi:hypothetical protein
MSAELRPLPPAQLDLNYYVDWHRYALEDFRFPMDPPAGAQEWRRQLSPTRRAAFNHARTLHHNTFGPVRTAAFEELLAQMRRQLVCNEATDPVRWGTLLLGPAGAGKTELLKNLGRAYTGEQLARADISGALAPSLYVPCVHVAVPSERSLKAFNQTVLRFYGAPTDGTKDDMTQRIIAIARACRTEVFLIDDINKVQPRYRDGAELAQHFKTLMQALPATFIFAGTPEAESRLLHRTDEHGASEVDQTGGRLVAREVLPMAVGSREQNRQWAEVVKAFERFLILRDHEPKLLLQPETLAYLHDRTQGYLGSLSRLIRGAANEAIEAGGERITREVLDAVKLDARAEAHRRRAPEGSRAA